MKNFRKRWSILLAVVLTICLGRMTIYASSNVIDRSRTGSITITLLDEKTKEKIGGNFRVYQIGTISDESPTLTYKLTDAFRDCGTAIDDLEADGLAAHLSAYADEHQISGNAVNSDADGTAKTDGLQVGLYLVVQNEAVSGYYAISPFLVSVPMTSADGSEWIYDIEASPKTQTRTDINEKNLTVKKIWKDGNSTTRPKEITAALLQDGKEVETVKLNASNSWSYSWKKLSSASSWSVVEKQVPSGYTASYRTGDSQIVITNSKPGSPTTPSGDRPKTQKDTTLLQTGQLIWPIPVLLGVGLILIVIGLIFRKRKTDASEERRD